MRSVRLTVGITWFVSIALNVVQYFRCEIQLLIDGDNSCNALRMSPIFLPIITYMTVMRPISTFALPLSALCFCNAFLIKAIRKYNKAHHERLAARYSGDVTTAKGEHGLTRTLIVLVVVFVICQLPDVVLLFVIVTEDFLESSLAASNINRAVLGPSTVACDAERREIFKYSNLLSTYIFIPIAVEIIGAVGAS